MERVSVFLNGKNIPSRFSIQCNGVTADSSKFGKCSTIYAADGGLNLVLKEKVVFEKMIWAGDQDSLNLKSRKFLEQKKRDHSVEQILLNKRKDYSDFSLILDRLEKSYKGVPIFVEIFGGLGGRRDHETANIEETKRFVSRLKQGGACFFHGGIIVTSLPIKILDCKSRLVSIFAPKGFVEIKGGAYSGRFSFERPSHGLSNTIVGKSIMIKPTHVAVVYVCEQKIC